MMKNMNAYVKNSCSQPAGRDGGRRDPHRQDHGGRLGGEQVAVAVPRAVHHEHPAPVRHQEAAHVEGPEPVEPGQDGRGRVPGRRGALLGGGGADGGEDVGEARLDGGRVGGGVGAGVELGHAEGQGVVGVLGAVCAGEEERRAHVARRAGAGAEVQQELVAPEQGVDVHQAPLRLEHQVRDAEHGVGEADQGAAGARGVLRARRRLVDGHENDEAKLRGALLDQREAGGGAGAVVDDRCRQRAVARGVRPQVIHDCSGIRASESCRIVDGFRKVDWIKGVI